MRVARLILLIVTFVMFSLTATALVMCPDGSYIASGCTCEMAPDGSYVCQRGNETPSSKFSIGSSVESANSLRRTLTRRRPQDALRDPELGRLAVKAASDAVTGENSGAYEKYIQRVSQFFDDPIKALEFGDRVIGGMVQRAQGAKQTQLLHEQARLQEKRARTEFANDFEACKVAVSKAVGYSASYLSGSGAPFQEAGYKSFYLKGRGKDVFFCEVYSGQRYKIKKALLNGKRPYKYIAEGNL